MVQKVVHVKSALYQCFRRKNYRNAPLFAFFSKIKNSLRKMLLEYNICYILIF